MLKEEAASEEREGHKGYAVGAFDSNGRNWTENEVISAGDWPALWAYHRLRQWRP